ncbi:MAG: hypothetical protein KJ852_06500 [Gammaproteobacteria bacterium]|nr:hypothetical protein [Gammaproteobacteria bacterium]MBU0788814.1 hypothetical protein [Gammaproteobacteria bacterium]MBU0814566.1 hypothetical protein [Gammaproteobacteria bacterium]MBU1786591.1 hypothetical protein [Gammaproteobacteria bacterium]
MAMLAKEARRRGAPSLFFLRPTLRRQVCYCFNSFQGLINKGWGHFYMQHHKAPAGKNADLLTC